MSERRNICRSILLRFAETFDFCLNVAYHFANHINTYARKGKGHASYLSKTACDELTERRGKHLRSSTGPGVFQARAFCCDCLAEIGLLCGPFWKTMETAECSFCALTNDGRWLMETSVCLSFCFWTFASWAFLNNTYITPDSRTRHLGSYYLRAEICKVSFSVRRSVTWCMGVEKIFSREWPLMDC